MPEMWVQIEEPGGGAGPRSEVLDAAKLVIQALARVLPILPGDEPVSISGSFLAAPLGMRTLLSITLDPGYRYYIRKLYVDAADGCSYMWVLPGGRIFYGNEHELMPPVRASGGDVIMLIVVNTDTVAQELDYLISGWARHG